MCIKRFDNPSVIQRILILSNEKNQIKVLQISYIFKHVEILSKLDNDRNLI